MNMIFKIHTVPLYPYSKEAVRWWKNQESQLSVIQSLREEIDHLEHCSTKKKIDRSSGLIQFLTISAITIDREVGKCSALVNNRCSIYESRPISCKCVPFHYSRAESTLVGYFDKFVRTDGYACDTSDAAPEVLDGITLTDPHIREARQAAFRLANEERAWKAEILRCMEGHEVSDFAILPTYPEILSNSNAGFATMVPIVFSWKIALRVGLIDNKNIEN
jgi:Fe-S-cluster containining protein